MARNQETESAETQPDTRTVSAVDRFDSVVRSGRVGAHRIVGRPRRFLAYLLSALIGVALLTGVGILVVQTTGADVSSWLDEEEEIEAPAPEPTVEAVLDPTAEVVVLNGTAMPGFAAIVDSIITQNQLGQILFSGDAAATDVEISAVFYGSVADEAAALGLAKELGGVSTYQSYEYLQEYGARLVVLIGADYGGPGSDQLVIPEPSGEAEADAGDEAGE
ncbi:MAG: hypothetical protein GX862_09335 [Leucobacter sp.]|nr:hypothetical protein [Leucobacter sp.]